MARHVDPLGGLACASEQLTRFIPRDLRDPDEADRVELSRLLATTSRSANAAFLASLLSSGSSNADEADLEELRRLTISATRERAVAALSPHLAAAALPPSADEAEARSLIPLATQPRTRALVRLAGARLAAGAARLSDAPRSIMPVSSSASVIPASAPFLATSLAPRAPMTAPAVAVKDLPPAQSCVAVVSAAGRTADAARAVCQAISGVGPAVAWRIGVGGDGGDGGSVEAYPWLVHTRYYAATVWLVAIATAEGEGGGGGSELEGERAALMRWASSCAGLVLTYADGRAQSRHGSWGWLVDTWQELSAEGGEGGGEGEGEGEGGEGGEPAAEILIALGLGGCDGDGDGDGDGDAKLDWCLDSGLELIEAGRMCAKAAEGPRSGWAAELAAAAVAAGGGGGGSGEEAEGLCRLVEALECRMWEAHEGAREAARARHVITVDEYKALVGAATANAPSAQLGGLAVTAEEEAMSERLLRDLAGDEPQTMAAADGHMNGAVTQAEVMGNGHGNGNGNGNGGGVEEEHERYERLLERMSYLRERGGELSAEDRRERAAGAAMEMARMFGGEDGDDSDESDE